MNEIFTGAKEICDFMQERKWEFCIIGGLAVIRWGEPRLTQDADLALLTGFGDEERYVRLLLEHFKGRLSDPLNFALSNRVLLLYTSNGIEVDISLGALNYEIEMIQHTSLFEYAPGVVLPTCSADDLFIMKAFAGRPQDWLDIQGLIIRQGSQLDHPYIFKHLGVLSELKGAPEIMKQARSMLCP